MDTPIDLLRKIIRSCRHMESLERRLRETRSDLKEELIWKKIRVVSDNHCNLICDFLKEYPRHEKVLEKVLKEKVIDRSML